MSKKKANVAMETPKAMEKPLICAIDLDDSDIKMLISKGFNIHFGSLGRVKKVKTNSFFKSQLDIPENLHEFDFAIFDFKERPAIQCEADDSKSPTKAKTNSFIMVGDHQLFDPIPFSTLLVQSQLHDSVIKIIFAASKTEVSYEFCEFDGRACSYTGSDNYSNNLLYSHYFCENKGGKQTYISDTPFKEFLIKYNSQMYYECTFGIYDYHKNVDVLMTNKFDDAISYFQYDNELNILEIVFPQLDNKAEFLHELFSDVLPELMPNFFPDIVKAAWKNTSPYFLPNQQQLLEDKERLVHEYNEKIDEQEAIISNNTREYSFLHDMLTATGDTLVQAFILYLKWLGFEKVIDKDNEAPNPNGMKEEDIQVEFDKGLLVIECKGIGGTSKDHECSQILKIINRRSQERKSFDVYGLYVVNHQRHYAPLDRSNPPFSKVQIKDAENERRGLLTTWELFKLYFIVEQNLIDKKTVRESLLKYGLIMPIEDNLVFIGVVKEIFDNGYIAIINLSGTLIQTGENILCDDGQFLSPVKIINMQLNDENIDSIDDGEIGVKFDNKISKGARLFKIIKCN